MGGQGKNIKRVWQNDSHAATLSLLFICHSASLPQLVVAVVLIPAATVRVIRLRA